MDWLPETRNGHREPTSFTKNLGVTLLTNFFRARVDYLRGDSEALSRLTLLYHLVHLAILV